MNSDKEVVKYCILAFLLLSFDCFSQGLTIDAIKRYALKNDEINGNFILNDIKRKSQEKDPVKSKSCDESKKEDKELELIFVASVSNPRKGEVTRFESLHAYPHQKYQGLSEVLRVYGEPREVRTLSAKSLREVATLYVRNIQDPENPKRPLLKTYSDLFIKGASEFYDESKKNDYETDKEIVDWFSKTMKGASFTEEESLLVINNILSSLEGNYNTDRLFTKKADNENRYFARQANGVVNAEMSDGGVCNDIHAVGCDLYNSLYPEKDCLILGYNSPSNAYHEVMAIGDGTSDYKILNYGRLSSIKGSRYLTAHPTDSPLREYGEFIRVQKYTDGKLRDIYLNKNEYGHWISSLNQSSLKGGDISDMLRANDPNHFAVNLIQSIKRKKEKDLKLGVGNATLSDGAKVYAVYARYDKRKQNLSGLSISLTASQKKSGASYNGAEVKKYKNNLNRFHLNTKFNQGILHYKKSGIKVTGVSFVDLELLGGWGSGTTFYQDGRTLKGINGSSFDGGIGTGINLGVEYEKEKTKVKGEVQQRWNLGSRDYNAMYGVRTNFWESLKQFRFHHQALEAKVKVSQKLSKENKVFVVGEYYGTNVGQNYGARAGLEINNPHKDIEVIVVAGYSGQGKGFQTKKNWLNEVGNKGINVGVGIKSKSTGVKVQIDGNLGDTPGVRGKASIPLYQKNKEQKIKGPPVKDGP